MCLSIRHGGVTKVVDVTATSEEDARGAIVQMQHAKLDGIMECRMPHQGLLLRFRKWLYKVLVSDLI